MRELRIGSLTLDNPFFSCASCRHNRRAYEETVQGTGSFAGFQRDGKRQRIVVQR